MAGRLRFGVAVAVCAFGAQSLFAQGIAPVGMDQVRPAAVYADPGTPWITSGYGPAVGYPGANTGYTPPSGPVYDDGMIVDHQSLQFDDGELAETPIEKAIKRGLHSSWVRFDYLHWHIDDPGDVLVGESTTTIGDGFLTQYYPLNGNRDLADEYFRDVDLERIGLRDVSGVQTTIGLPTTIGTFELSGFMLQQASDEVIARDLPGVGPSFFGFLSAPLNVGITTTINGEPVDAGTAATVLFNNSFLTRVTTDVWGAEFNWIMDPVEPGEGYKWFRPLLGFRYLALQEQMRVNGTNIDLDTGEFLNAGKVSVENFNNIYGPQFGWRTELVHRWFTIGVEPKFTLGANSFLGSMRTSDLYGDGPVNEKIREGEFCAVGDLDVYARIPLGEYCAFFVSYNLTIASDVARPWDNARYDVLVDDSDNVTNNFHIDDKTKSFRLEGYTLGIEIIFP